MLCWWSWAVSFWANILAYVFLITSAQKLPIFLWSDTRVWN
jgi:hypothetical protein